MSIGLTPEEVIYRIENGETQSEIARAEGCSRQYVSQLAKRGGWESPFKTMAENMPWDVPAELRNNTIYKNVRRHGIWTTTNSLSEVDKAHLRAFLQRLDLFQSVVDYDPEYPPPPKPGYSNTRGFTYLPRTEADEDYIIRIKPGVRITPVGRHIWRIPSNMP